MYRKKRRISIGMPVFNGEAYIKESLDSILTQTYEDFELIVSDNASTDQTEEICRVYAEKDQRISYYRQKENIGASKNFNNVFELSKGEFFKWAAHDDLCAPDYLRQCVEVLHKNPSVILCYSRSKAIDEHGEVIKNYPAKPDTGASKQQKRFYEIVCVPHPCVAVWGVMRANVLKKTRLIGNYTGSDRPLLSELSLLGKFYEIPQYLFFLEIIPCNHGGHTQLGGHNKCGMIRQDVLS